MSELVWIGDVPTHTHGHDPDKMFRDAIRSNIRNSVSKGAHEAPQNVVADVVNAVSPKKHAILPASRMLQRAAKMAKKLEFEKEFALHPDANLKSLDTLVISASMTTHHEQNYVARSWWRRCAASLRFWLP